MGAGLSALCFIATSDLPWRYVLEEFPSISLLSEHTAGFPVEKQSLATYTNNFRWEQ